MSAEMCGWPGAEGEPQCHLPAGHQPATHDRRPPIARAEALAVRPDANAHPDMETRLYCAACERYVKEVEVVQFYNLGKIHNINGCMSGRVAPRRVRKDTLW